MADQILNAIIELESQIERQLQLEQQKANAWLAGKRSELEREAEQQRQQIRATNQRLQEEAEQQIEKRCQDILNAEMEYCRRLEGLSKQALLEVLRRQLERILPRPVDDHQNGES